MKDLVYQNSWRRVYSLSVAISMSMIWRISQMNILSGIIDFIFLLQFYQYIIRIFSKFGKQNNWFSFNSDPCSKMIQKMKKQSRLNNAALRQLLVPALEHLDLSGVYITDSTLKMVWRSCPNLRVLSLKDCGYIVTDSLMEQLVKVTASQTILHFFNLNKIRSLMRSHIHYTE